MSFVVHTGEQLSSRTYTELPAFASYGSATSMCESAMRPVQHQALR